MKTRLALALSFLALSGCAEGTDNPTFDTTPGLLDVGVMDAVFFEPYLWPDLGLQPDGFVCPDGLPDGPGDALVDGWPLDGPPSDLSKPCNDVYEANEICSLAKYLGSVSEGSSWVSKTATLDPAADVDWFSAKGLEGSHVCFPFTSQTYYFKVRIYVPSGRTFKVCLYKDSCTGSVSCKDNSTVSAPTTLEVQYKVSGTCALNDDTEARIVVQPLDGKGGCSPYTVSFNYNG